jgi:hypothetical protein
VTGAVGCHRLGPIKLIAQSCRLCTGVAAHDPKRASFEALDTHRCVVIVSRAIPKLASASVTPTKGLTIILDRATPRGAGADGCDPTAQTGHVNWRGVAVAMRTVP